MVSPPLQCGVVWCGGQRLRSRGERDQRPLLSHRARQATLESGNFSYDKPLLSFQVAVADFVPPENWSERARHHDNQASWQETVRTWASLRSGSPREIICGELGSQLTQSRGVGQQTLQGGDHDFFSLTGRLR